MTHAIACAQYCAQWRVICACTDASRIAEEPHEHCCFQIRTNPAKLLIVRTAIPSKQRVAGSSPAAPAIYCFEPKLLRRRL